MTPVREEVVKGLEILYRGTTRGLFPESSLPDLHAAIQLIVAKMGLDALHAIPPDDRMPDHAELEAVLRGNIERLTGRRY